MIEENGAAYSAGESMFKNVADALRKEVQELRIKNSMLRYQKAQVLYSFNQLINIAQCAASGTRVDQRHADEWICKAQQALAFAQDEIA